MVLEPVFPPRQHAETAVQRGLDRNEIVFVQFFEQGVAVGAPRACGRLEQEVLEHVHVAEADGEVRTEGWGVRYGVGGADEGEVAGEHRFVCGRRAGPGGGAGEGGGDADGAGELPIADVVHDICQDLDR